MAPERRSLAELLIEEGMLTRQQLDQAKEEAKQQAIPIEKVILKAHWVSEEDLAIVRALTLNVPYVDPSDYQLNPETMKLVPETIARRYRLVPLARIGSTCTVLMADPQNVPAIDEVRRATQCDIEVIMGTEGRISEAIDQYYGARGSIEDLVKEIDQEKLKRLTRGGEERAALEGMAGEAPVIKLVNLLIMQAVRDRASDIHLEPEEDRLRVRFRIDGILHDISPIPKHLEPPIVSRIKLLAAMDIAEKRKPQDGRMQVKLENHTIDLRVSTLPTAEGENCVLRLLDRAAILLGLSQLGLSPQTQPLVEELIRRPYGILLVTGPTGSGKTTTLYAAMQGINSEDTSIVTIEDPIEYRLPGVRQSQVNAKTGYIFAEGLRSILRQDPDVIMVGEIRDRETAEVAIQAALTGHLVFSTLHTNDAPSAMTRLVDMGIEPFLIASSVLGVLAQRLVRLICANCREAFVPPASVIAELGLPHRPIQFWRGRGCPTCKGTGYRGRLGIFELMAIGDEIKQLTLAKTSASEIAKAARTAGMRSLRDDGVEKVIAGLTSLEEVLRATQE